MPFNGFSVGKDVTIDIQTQNGYQQFNLITGFKKKQETNQVLIKGLDGIVRPLELPQGWSGSFDLERQDSSVDDYFANIESAYYSGLNVLACTMSETIQEANGAVTQYRYEGVTFRLEDAGDWQGEQSVKMHIGWYASRRKKVL